MRVLADTNVLISFLLSPGEGGAIRAIFRAFVNDQFTLLLPEQLLSELIASAQNKPRLAKRISAEQLSRFTALLVESAERIAEIEYPIPAVVRDPDDDFVLAYALVGTADYLVTGDRDLLVLNDQIAGLTILTPAQFAALLPSLGNITQ